MELEIVSFEQGLQRIMTKILNGKELPVLISIHGLPNAGKSHLKLTAHRNLRNLGKNGWSGMRGDSLDRFPNFKEQNLSFDYFLIEDMPHIEGVYDYTLKNFGRKPDLCVCMSRNFDLNEISGIWKEYLAKEGYGLLINNPEARIKLSPY